MSIAIRDNFTPGSVVRSTASGEVYTVFGVVIHDDGPNGVLCTAEFTTLEFSPDELEMLERAPARRVQKRKYSNNYVF